MQNQYGFKVFSKKDYEENHNICVATFSEFIKDIKKYRLIDDKDKFCDYDVQIQNIETGEIVLVELERKLTWKKSFEWGDYPTIHIPYRKIKSKSDIFIMFNERMDAIAAIKMSDVHKAKVVFKNTKYSKAERFFELEPQSFFFYSKRSKKWKANS